MKVRFFISLSKKISLVWNYVWAAITKKEDKKKSFATHDLIEKTQNKILIFNFKEKRKKSDLFTLNKHKLIDFVLEIYILFNLYF